LTPGRSNGLVDKLVVPVDPQVVVGLLRVQPVGARVVRVCPFVFKKFTQLKKDKRIVI